ncbi:MAG: imidazole glycerol phosphate synthase subunit HisH [Alphaproteobacteria bacterium]|jgi:glutamine amidotransferase
MSGGPMNIAVVDCGSGNLRSVVRAVERAASLCEIATTVTVTQDPDHIAAADRLVLPGQGAFASCLHGLAMVDGLHEALTHAVMQRGTPFLGICIGMQLMAYVGEEHGQHKGFGWIPGRVTALRPSDPSFKVPHMGWNALVIQEPAHPILANLPPDPHVYFANSYQFVCDRAEDRLAWTDFAGPVTAVVGRDNFVGTQFHPEKSQAVGLAVLQQFMRWNP